jgi:ubiquinone/menaquinone biosynthesis C-methylase UbiE
MNKVLKDVSIGEVGLRNQSNREVWLEKTLTAIPAGLRILDAGAGELQYKRFCTHLNYVSQDFGKYEGAGNREGKQTGSWDNSKLDIVSDITAIPEPDASFDAIMCIEVFEHIPEPAKAVKEFARLLKPGGTLIITAPFASLTHFAPYHFASGYTKYWYEKWLPEYEFMIDEIVRNGNYFEYLAQEVRRIPGVAEQYGNRKESLFGKMIRFGMLVLLHRLSHTDTGSGEMLCYGLQVRAHKKT